MMLLCLALVVPGCGGGPSAHLTPPPAQGYVLDTGDELRINIFGLDGYGAVTYVVGEDGNLTLPVLDKVPAAGMTSDQLAASLRQLLLDREILKQPSVDVQLATLRPFHILGEVNKPGEYEFRPGMSVLTAVSIAGGFTYRAKEKDVIISRKVGGRQVTGKAAATDLIQPGDQIQVTERWF
jgi:polysaccharide export outer membrane protein